MLSTPTFYFLWIVYALGTTAGQMTISQLVPFARTAGLGATLATYSLVVTSVGNAGGRILSGWFSDTFGRVRTLMLMVLLSAVAMPALFIWRTEALAFFVLVALVVLVLRHPALRLRLDDGRFLRDAQPGPELRSPLHRLGRRRASRARNRRACLRSLRRLSIRVLRGGSVCRHGLPVADEGEAPGRGSDRRGVGGRAPRVVPAVILSRGLATPRGRIASVRAGAFARLRLSARPG